MTEVKQPRNPSSEVKKVRGRLLEGSRVSVRATGKEPEVLFANPIMEAQISVLEEQTSPSCSRNEPGFPSHPNPSAWSAGSPGSRRHSGISHLLKPSSFL